MDQSLAARQVLQPPTSQIYSEQKIDYLPQALSSPENHPSDPPYAPTTAALGGQPTVSLDIPITSVFLLLFILGAAAHMTIFQLNKRRGHKFIMSGAMFGFCMARIITCVMRIVWAAQPTNVSVAIAASIFVAAGVIVLLIINLFFAQRIIRAAHPHTGWHPFFSLAFKCLYALIILTLILIISFTVLSFNTLDPSTRNTARDIQLYGGTLNATIALLPIPLVLLGIIIPRRTRLEKFGAGRHRSKILILLTAAFLLSLGAWFRVGTLYLPPRPRADPAWYHSKACFYVFNFGIESVVIWLYVLLRVDRRFHIPDGSKGPGDYMGKGLQENRTSEKTVTRVMTEEEVFDDAPEEDGEGEVNKGPGGVKDVEKGRKAEKPSDGAEDLESGTTTLSPVEAEPGIPPHVDKGTS
ncbi:hypothetical protein MMC30_006891 [Trapelia coarctata]|nr:hypothetical protein [Trapelia coarctata]